MKSDLVYLYHIDESIDLIHQYSRGSKELFLNDSLVRDGVLRRLQTLAESTSRLSDESKAAFPEVDWRGIVGFRNIVTHNYMGIDLDVTWEIMSRYLLQLKEVTQELITRYTQ